MVSPLAVAANAYWKPEEIFGEVKFTIGKQATAWNADSDTAAKFRINEFPVVSVAVLDGFAASRKRH